MDCQTCKKLLSRFLDNELDKKQQLLMTKHIEDCPACAQSLESISEMVRMMHEIKAVNPPADFIKKVNKRLDELPFWDKVLIGVRDFFFLNHPIKSLVLLTTLILVFAVTGKLNIHTNKTSNSADSLVLRGGAVEPKQKRSSEVEIAHQADKTNAYIKDNSRQILSLSLAEQDDFKLLKETILSLNPIDFEQINRDDQQVFLFKITYENFLKMHSILAGFGQLEKNTPTVVLHENKANSLAWQKEAYSQLIYLEIRVSQ